MARNNWPQVIEDVPDSAARLALSRCRNFAEAALALRVRNIDFIDCIVTSCYLQGVTDGAEVNYRRTEGTYEEER